MHPVHLLCDVGGLGRDADRDADHGRASLPVMLQQRQRPHREDGQPAVDLLQLVIGSPGAVAPAVVLHAVVDGRGVAFEVNNRAHLHHPVNIGCLPDVPGQPIQKEQVAGWDVTTVHERLQNLQCQLERFVFQQGSFFKYVTHEPDFVTAEPGLDGPGRDAAQVRTEIEMMAPPTTESVDFKPVAKRGFA